MAKPLYEILVPTVRNGDGKPFRLRYHRVWDEKVRAITGGLTIVAPVRGQWVSPTGEVFKERMIPVRVMATREEIEKIADLTAAYYDQKAIMYYKISEEAEIRYYDGSRKPKITRIFAC